MTDHDSNVFVKSTLREKLAGLKRDETPIDDRPISILPICRFVCDLLGIGADNGF